MTEEVVKLGERGQITIPMRIRKKKSLRAKSLLRVYEVDDLIVLKKISEKPLNLELTLKKLQKLGMTEKDWKEIEKSREVR